MVRYRRNLLAGGTFFFTATLADRTSSVLTDHVAALRSAVKLTRRQHPFMIDAVVVLPDHLHIIMTLPDGDADFPTRWQLVKRRFTVAVTKAGCLVARRRNGEYALWQRRFWEHTIRNQRDFERHVDYIHFNPVKHGLTTRVRDWPYSSFHRYVQRGILPEDWGGDLGQVQGNFGE
jgi:putative transposase